jgi:hypothetical protein
VYVYLNGMKVKGSPFSRQTVPLILILTAEGSTACTCRGDGILVSSDCPFNSNPDCRGKHRVYVYTVHT